MKRSLLKIFAAFTAATALFQAAAHTENVCFPAVRSYAMPGLYEEYVPDNVSSDVVWNLDENGVLRIALRDSIPGFEADGSGSWDKYADKIEYAVIEEGISEITEGMFYYCTGLKGIYIPASVINIQDARDNNYIWCPFHTCEKLENISVAEENMKYSSIEGVLFNRDKNCIVAYPRGSRRSVYNAPEGTMKIYHCAFSETPQLEKVILPETLEYIDKRAFGSSAIKSVNIPSCVKTISEFAFYECKSLEKADLSTGLVNIERCAFEFCSSLKEIEFPDTLGFIDREAFRYTALSEVYLPDSLTDMNVFVFEDCPNLRRIRFSAGMKKIDNFDVGSRDTLEEAEIPEGITEIKERAFENCKKLKKVTVPPTVQKIGSRAFLNCRSLKRIELPEDVIIEDDAFKGCGDIEIVYTRKRRRLAGEDE